jgi:hypothetical protein
MSALDQLRERENKKEVKLKRKNKERIAESWRGSF